MPPGAPFNSFLNPYPIRVDAFATPIGDLSFKPPALHLLTHTHSDHIVGLSSQSFAGLVVCSETAKEMLLRYEVTKDRINYDNGVINHKRRSYSHLRIDSALVNGRADHSCARDLLRAIPLNTPTEFELSATLTVRITAIDANHCPGAVMFLVEGPHGPVLHTGDVRAEPWFIQSLARNPLLQRFMPHPDSDWPPPEGSPIQVLGAVFLDTAMLMALEDIPTKDEATSGLIELMGLFDLSANFFLNTWTWGYEDVLKAVARRFNTKIHVDRYKAAIYRCGDDHWLKSIITTGINTRFHACERLNRCSAVSNDGRDIVYVNPAEMSTTNWELYRSETSGRLRSGERVTNLIVPFSRHSGLVELRGLVSLFRPKKVVPNGLLPGLNQLDWVCMPAMFEACMAPGGAEKMHLDMRSAIPSYGPVIPAVESQVKNIAVENVEGEGAKDIALLWSSKEPIYGRDTLMARFNPFLPKELVDFIEENWDGLAAEGAEMQEGEEEAGSSDDEADVHNQDWRADILGVKREDRSKERRIDSGNGRPENLTRCLLLADGKKTTGDHIKRPQMSSEVKVPESGKRRREEEPSTSTTLKKRRIKSPEYTAILSSPPPPPSSSRAKPQEHNPSPRIEATPSSQTRRRRQPASSYKDKARELRSKINLAKLKSSVGDHSVASAPEHISRLSAAWSQMSSKVITPSAQEIRFQIIDVEEAGSNATRSVTPPQKLPIEADVELLPSIDLNHTRALLNRLIAEKGHWIGLSCVGSQSQSQ